MSRLRPVSVVGWAVVGVIVLALIPHSIPLDPVRAAARYMLVAYLPGLVIWNRLRSDQSLVDLVLYPSLLSVLPFTWVALGAIAVGLDLRAAVWTAIALFLVIGFWLGWSRPPRVAPGERVVLIIAAALAILLLAVPFAANAFEATAWDAPLHAAIVSRILGDTIPPDSPMMAGQPVNYYWLYHFYAAVLSRLTSLRIYQVFACLNVHALVLFTLVGYRIAGRLSASMFGRLSAAWALVFGLNAFGWIIFLAHGSQNPDRWYSLVVPFAMVRGYSPSLGSLIHEFLDGGPFAMSFAFDLAWLDAVLGRIDGERGPTLIVGTLVLATAFYLHLLCGVFLIAGSLTALLCLLAVDAHLFGTASRGWARDVGGMALVAALVSAPYAWNIVHAKVGQPLSVAFDFGFMKHQAWSIVACLGLVGGLATPAAWRALRSRSRKALFLMLFAGAITAAALVTNVALDAEYKLIYLLALAVGPLVALAWDVWQRTLLRRLSFVIALALCVPTNALTSYAFMTRPPREIREPSRMRLLQWIRDQTPANAILVEHPYWAEGQNSDAAYLYLDRYWFDIAIYAGRRQLIGYGGDILEQWGYRDIAVRQALATKLMNGQPLDASDEAYLNAFAAPIIVVTDSAAPDTGTFDPAAYAIVYEDGNVRAYRVAPQALRH